MKLRIEPYKRVGSIEFGMTAEKVRSLFPEKPETFKKFSDLELTTDAFDQAGVYVYYNANNVCDAVEMFPEAVPIFKGKSLLTIPWLELMKWFQELEPDVVIGESGLTSFRFGISLYVPNVDELPEAPPESLIVFDHNSELFSHSEA